MELLIIGGLIILFIAAMKNQPAQTAQPVVGPISTQTVPMTLVLNPIIPSVAPQTMGGVFDSPQPIGVLQQPNTPSFIKNPDIGTFGANEPPPPTVTSLGVQTSPQPQTITMGPISQEPGLVVAPGISVPAGSNNGILTLQPPITSPLSPALAPTAGGGDVPIMSWPSGATTFQRPNGDTYTLFPGQQV
jgi:hypothetical protein